MNINLIHRPKTKLADTDSNLKCRDKNMHFICSTCTLNNMIDMKYVREKNYMCHTFYSSILAKKMLYQALVERKTFYKKGQCQLARLGRLFWTKNITFVKIIFWFIKLSLKNDQLITLVFQGFSKNYDKKKLCLFRHLLLYLLTSCPPVSPKPINSKDHKCENCNKVFASLSYLKIHMQCHSRKKPSGCIVCDNQFYTAGALKEHRLENSGEKSFVCTVCDKYFSRAQNMESHIRTHTGKRPFLCTECNMCFSQSTTLDRHILTHSGVKPYNSTSCNTSFSQKSTLNAHTRTHTGLKPYTCTNCDTS